MQVRIQAVCLRPRILHHFRLFYGGAGKQYPPFWKLYFRRQERITPAEYVLQFFEIVLEKHSADHRAVLLLLDFVVIHTPGPADAVFIDSNVNVLGRTTIMVDNPLAEIIVDRHLDFAGAGLAVDLLKTRGVGVRHSPA